MRHGRTAPLRLTIKLSNHMETPTHTAPPVASTELFGLAAIRIMHAALPPDQRLMLDRLTETPGFNARMECLKRYNGDPSGDEWVHFGDMMKTLGEPLSHHLTAERSALRPKDDDGRARVLTMLFGPPDVVFEKWYGDTLMWSVTHAEFWAFNAEILEALKSLTNASAMAPPPQRLPSKKDVSGG